MGRAFKGKSMIAFEVKEVQETGKGYDWFGPCEICGNRCDNHYMQRVNGSAMARFGHLDCVRLGDFVDAKIKAL